MFFLELSCFFDDPPDVGNLISGSSAFSKISLNVWKFMVHILLRPGLENFERYFTSVWDECNCAVVWAFFGIAFLWNWNENRPFPVLWPLLSFPNLLAYCVQHFHLGPAISFFLKLFVVVLHSSPVAYYTPSDRGGGGGGGGSSFSIISFCPLIQMMKSKLKVNQEFPWRHS